VVLTEGEPVELDSGAEPAEVEVGVDWSCAEVEEREERLRINKVVSEVEDTILGALSSSSLDSCSEVR
jgi:hypothetical protein